MPVYLLHGFRWPREGFHGIKVHTILHNLEDCSVEYIQNARSRNCILESFHRAFPDVMHTLAEQKTSLEFIEQYHPDDESDAAVTQPYAFVGDRVVVIGNAASLARPQLPSAFADTPPDSAVTPASPTSLAGAAPPPAQQQQQQPTTTTTTTTTTGARGAGAADTTTALSLNIDEVLSTGPGLTNKAWEALADLRDKIAEGEKIGWWVVYNGDPERAVEPSDDEDEDEDDESDDAEAEDEAAQEEDVDVPGEVKRSAAAAARTQLQSHPLQQQQLPQTQPQTPTQPTQPQSPRQPGRYSASPPSVSTTFRRGNATQHISQQIQPGAVAASSKQTSPSIGTGLSPFPAPSAHYPPPPPQRLTPPMPATDVPSASPTTKDDEGRVKATPEPSSSKTRSPGKGLRNRLFGKRA